MRQPRTGMFSERFGRRGLGRSQRWRRTLGRVAIVGACVLTAGLVVGWRASEASARESDSLARQVATVDLERVITDLAEFKQAMQDRADRDESRRAKLESLASEFNALQQEIELLNQNDYEAIRATNARLLRKQQELQLEQELAQQLRGLEEVDALKSVYPKILSGIERVAKDGGYEIVLSNIGEDRLVSNNPQEARRELSLQVLLYAASATDITDEVINRLNAEYAAGGG